MEPQSFARGGAVQFLSQAFPGRVRSIVHEIVELEMTQKAAQIIASRKCLSDPTSYAILSMGQLKRMGIGLPTCNRSCSAISLPLLYCVEENEDRLADL